MYMQAFLCEYRNRKEDESDKERICQKKQLALWENVSRLGSGQQRTEQQQCKVSGALTACVFI